MVIQRLIGLLSLIFFCFTVFAQPLYQLTESQNARFEEIIEQYRCIVCQGQSLADAGNPISSSIKHKIVELIHQGKSNRQIDDYLVRRYGDYIRFMPRLTFTNALLWFAPFSIMVMLAFGVRKKYYGQLTERSF